MTRPALALFAALIASFAACGFASAQGFKPASAPASSEPGADLRIYLMTFSPGSIIYERFGHNTLVVHDPNPSAERIAERAKFQAALEQRIGGRMGSAPPLLRTDRAYHYGAFDFEQDGFVPRFVMGRMEYWTTSDWADYTALLYAADNRSVLLQELNLTPAQKLAMREFLEWNERPENRFYRYDYYRDNCSTRVRDAIDRVTGGQLQRQMKSRPTGMTYRAHTRRLTAGADPLDVFWFTGFTYVLGHPVDAPLTQWEEAFIPQKLAEHVRQVTLPDANAPGGTRPLVLGEEWMAKTSRPLMPEVEPTRTTEYAIAGVLVGGAFAGLAWLGTRARHVLLTPSPRTPGEGGREGSPSRRNARVAIAARPHPNPLLDYGKKGPKGILPRLARVAFALLVIPWTLIWSIGSLIAANGWAFTDHAASYRNENLLQISPLIVPLVVLAPMVAFGRRRGARVAVWLAVAGVAMSVLGLVLKVLPAFWQHNAEIIALALPANVGLALAMILFARRVGAFGASKAPSDAQAEPAPSRPRV